MWFNPLAASVRRSRGLAVGAATIGAAMLAALVLAGPARAQQEPTPGAVAAAKEMIEMKGAMNLFETLVPGVIETARSTLLRTSPNLSKDLTDVAQALRKEYAGKRADIAEEIARTYATQFNEKELREVIAFYKTPVGKKLIEVEPTVLEQSMTRVQSWAERFSDNVMTRFRAEMRKKGHNL
jgi:uncharacterized protein